MSARALLTPLAVVMMRPLALAASVLALAGASDAEPDRPTSCRTAGITVQIFEGSRLLEARGERLELVQGRALPCDDPRARPVLTALDGSLVDFPQQRLHEPVRIHLDPRLPARQAPLAGLEVHVTSREVLVASAVLGTLGPEAWRHELLHTLAAAPTPTSAEARRLWLTLEEGLVGYLTLAAGSALDPGARNRSPGSPLSSETEPPGSPGELLPLLEWLASPAYDPHPLAAGLTRELDRIAPHARLEPWLDCLSAEPAPVSESARAPTRTFERPLPPELASVFQSFIGRCSADARSTFSTAVAGWWGKPLTER